jgi:hypothetical protein
MQRGNNETKGDKMKYQIQVLNTDGRWVPAERESDYYDTAEQAADAKARIAAGHHKLFNPLRVRKIYPEERR